MRSFWAGRRVLVTGHTGFKGGWLCLWLERLGARVSAFALPADTAPALSDLFDLDAHGECAIVDLKDAEDVTRFVTRIRPEIVLHLGAQALVRRSYDAPVETFATNIMGTVHLFSALRACDSVKAVVVVTTDKVYENRGEGHPFAENDRLGGADPYSASKACAEIISRSFKASFFAQGSPALATARAGNVVGGGDWSQDRLVPDFVRALANGQPVQLRYPNAVRPWQHVLEPLAGYLALAQGLVERPAAMPDAVNFGPDPVSFAPVHRIAEALGGAFGLETAWRAAPGPHPPEATLLTLRSDLAEASLGWRPRLSLQATLDWTADWYRAHRANKNMRDFSMEQIARYEELLS